MDNVFLLQPDKQFLAVRKGQATIQRVASQLVQEKKRKILEGERTGKSYEGKDLLTLLRKHHITEDEVKNRERTFTSLPSQIERCDRPA